KSSRGMLSTMIGVENLLDTLRLLRALADGLATTHGTPPTQERLANIRRLLVGDGDNEIDARRAVVGEYLFVANTVRMMAVASMRKSVTHKLFFKILFDPPHALELVKPYFSSLMAFAEDPSEETAPPLPRFSRVSFGWWSYNAMGKLVLDASMGAMTPPLQKFADDRAEFISLREKVRMRLIAP
ncbi:MAG: hypothetical protein ACKVPX_14400, partial [Myxococcaceae bacterium]